MTMSCFLGMNFGEYTRSKANGLKIQQDVQTFWGVFKCLRARIQISWRAFQWCLGGVSITPTFKHPPQGVQTSP